MNPALAKEIALAEYRHKLLMHKDMEAKLRSMREQVTSCIHIIEEDGKKDFGKL